MNPGKKPSPSNDPPPEFSNLPMPLEEKIVRQIFGGEVHYYSVELLEGQVICVEVEESGIDVALFLFRAADEELLTELNFNYEYGRETLTFSIEQSGLYFVSVGTIDSGKAGSYEFFARVKPSATTDDTLRIQAEQELARILVEFENDTSDDTDLLIGRSKKLIPLWRKLKDSYWEGYMHTFLGLLYSNKGERKQALEHYQRAVPLRQKAEDRSGLAKTFYNIARIYSELHRTREARTFFLKAQALLEKINDNAGRALAFFEFGNLHSDMGEQEKAWAYYQKALKLIRKREEIEDEHLVLNELAIMYSTVGEKQAALKQAYRALLLKRETGDIEGQAATLNNIAGIYADLGETQKALELYQESLNLDRKIKNQSSESTTINNIGLIYSYLGEEEIALDYFFRSLSLIKGSGDSSLKATTLNNIGSSYYALGNLSKALEFYRRALKEARKYAIPSKEATFLGNIGLVYTDLEKTKLGLSYLNESLSLNRKAGNRAGEIPVLSNIASTQLMLGERTRALKLFFQALTTAKTVKNLYLEASILGDLMQAYQSENRIQLAIYFGKSSIKVFQKLRGKIRFLDKTAQQKYLKKVEVSFRSLIELLLESRRFNEALQILNLLKDQSFYDLSLDKSAPGKTGAGAEKPALTAGEMEIEAWFQTLLQSLCSTISGIEKTERLRLLRPLTNRGEIRLNLLVAQKRNISRQFQSFIKRIENYSDAKFTSETQNPVISKDTQRLQNALKTLENMSGGRVAALHTLIGEDAFWVLLITPDRIEAVSTPIKSSLLNEKILQLWGLLQSPEFDPQRAAHELYQIIFKPIEEKLPEGVKVIMWSLDGNLRYLPVSVLYDGTGYLIERFNNVVFTRVQKGKPALGARKDWQIIAFGNDKAYQVRGFYFPELPEVRSEISSIVNDGGKLKGVIKGSAILNEKFTKTVFVSALTGEYRIAHIASHFKFTPGNESDSFLLLGDGTMLNLEELKNYKNLFSGVEIIVLSACNTATQRPNASGREIDGFAELAQRLGARSVIASLWTVADQSTARLMSCLYRELLKRDSKAESLRQAQLSLLNEKLDAKIKLSEKRDFEFAKEVSDNQGVTPVNRNYRDAKLINTAAIKAPKFVNKDNPFSHPYYWAPFVLFGDWF